MAIEEISSVIATITAASRPGLSMDSISPQQWEIGAYFPLKNQSAKDRNQPGPKHQSALPNRCQLQPIDRLRFGHSWRILLFTTTIAKTFTVGE